MITIKDYAKQNGISHQAVYQMLGTHKEELDPYIVKQGRTRFLTDEAIEILEKYRQQAPIVMERQDQTAQIEELKRERDNLLIQTADLGVRLANLADWKAEKAVEIAAADQQKLLLTTAQADLKKAEAELQEAKEVIGNAKKLLDSKDEECANLRKQLEELQQAQERRLTWKERITGKKRKE